ncbi:MAG: NADH-quinone oxidoreductase subunit A, partial [Bdellovibrionales bacterium]|nr:NADH-quinone oxidoreductase subunit A [Bdellovibrionales bacterium]
MSQLIPVFALAGFVIIFGIALVIVAGLFGPKTKYSKMKSMSYECGLVGEGPETTKIPVKFYLTAILFILFDIEIIFMYPWAISFSEFIKEGQGLTVLLAMGFFLFVFIFGLVWEIKSRALE